MSLSDQSNNGPWVVRMWEGVPPGRRSEPILCHNLTDLEQCLSGIFGAISLMGPGSAFNLSVEESE